MKRRLNPRRKIEDLLCGDFFLCAARSNFQHRRGSSIPTGFLWSEYKQPCSVGLTAGGLQSEFSGLG